MGYYGNQNNNVKNAYQQNLTVDQPKQEYAFSTREVLNNIATVAKYDQAKADEYLSKFSAAQQSPSSQYYNPYVGATNKAVNSLASLGFDVSNINDDWFDRNGWLKKYYVYTANTNSLSSTMTNKKATPYQKAAYYYDQLYKARDKTRKAETEWDALQDELIYWAQNKDKNYSDEDIINRIDWSKYKTLVEMDESRMAGQPIELNHAVGYSRDAMYGVLWAARNGGSTGDMWQDMINSVRGTGWQDNPEISAKLAAGTETYAPYSVGSTLENEGLYFNRTSFDQKWIDENKEQYLGGTDETAKKMFQNVMKAEDFTKKCENQLEEMRSAIKDMLKHNFTSEQIIDTIKNGSSKYGDLFKLDDSMNSAELLPTTRAINYRMKDMEQEIMNAVAERDKRADTVGIFGNIFNDNASPLLPQFKIGQYGKGNIDLYNRTPVIDDEGYTETVNSFSVNINGKEVLLPSVVNGKILSVEEATDYFLKAEEEGRTPEYLGIFDTVEDANDYAKALHQQQEYIYGQENKPPLFTDTDISLEAATKAAYDGLNNTVQETGTDAEKTALLTGKTHFFKQTAYRLNKMSKDFLKSFTDSSTSKVVTDYYSNYGIVSDFRGHEEARDNQQKQLDSIMPEWNALHERESAVQGMYGLNANQFQTLQMIAQSNPSQSPTLSWVMSDLKENPDNQAALVALYKAVTGEGIANGAENDPSVVEGRLEQTKNWFNYINGTESGEIVPLSDEEVARYNELDQQKTSLEENIQKEDEYITANRRAYIDAASDVMFARDAYNEAVKTAQMRGQQIDPGLMNGIEYIYDVAHTGQKPSYSPYNAYDYSVMSEQSTRDEATEKASSDALLYNNSLKTLKDTYDYLVKAGVPFDDGSARNVAINLQEYEKAAYDAALVSLDGVEHFKEISDKGREEAKQGTNYQDRMLAMLRETGDDKYRQMNGPTQTSIDAISPEEIDRYFYLKGNGEEEKAQEYLNKLTDPDNGTLTIRKMMTAQQQMEEFASQPGLNPYIATGVSVASKLLGWGRELVYRGKQAIEGKAVSPYNEAFMLRNVGNAATRGINTALRTSANQLFGEGTIVGDALVKMQEIGEGTATYAVGSKVMGSLIKAFDTPLKTLTAAISPDTLTVRLVKSAAEVLPVTFESAGGVYQNALIQTGDETKAGLMWNVSLMSNLITHTVVMDGIHNAFKSNPSELSKGISGLFKSIIETDMAVGGSTLASSTIDELASKAILDADSQWGADFEEYNKKYPEEIAREMADHAMWERVANNTLQSIANATLRTVLLKGINYASSKVEPYIQKAAQKLDVAWKYFKNDFGDVKQVAFGDMANIPEELAGKIPDDVIVNPVNGFEGTQVTDRTKGATHTIVGYRFLRNGDIALYDKAGNVISYWNTLMKDGDLATDIVDDERDFLGAVWNNWKDTFDPDAPAPTFTQSPVNEQPESAAALPPVTPLLNPGDAEQYGKDMTIINSAYGADPTAASVGLSVVLGGNDPDVSKAAGQTLVGTLAGGDPKLAAAAMQQMLINTPNPANAKQDIIAAALTSGNGNQALQNILDKLQRGKKITKKDVTALNTGIVKDKKSDPKGFSDTIKTNVKNNRVAEKTIQIASQDPSIKKAESSVKDARDALSNAQYREKAAEADVNTAVQNMQGTPYDPKDKSTHNKRQNAVAGVAGAVKAEEAAKEARVVQEQKLAKEESKLKETQTNVMNAAREAALAEDNEEQEAKAAEDYNNAITNLTPTAPFVTARDEEYRPTDSTPRTITAYDSEGNEVILTGVYDRIETGEMGRNTNAGEENNGGRVGDTIIMYTTADGRLVMENLGYTDDDDNPIRQYGDVITEDDEAMDAADSLAGNRATNSDAVHPEIRPTVYFPSSFPVSVNGKQVQMIGLVGKEDFSGEEVPVIMGLDGRIYSAADIEVPFDYVDVVDETFDGNVDALEEIPREQITEVSVNGNTEGWQESPGQTEVTLPGTEREGDNEGQLPSSLGRDDGRGDLSDAGLDGGQSADGRSEEGPTESDGSTVRGVPERLLSRKTVKTLKNKGVTDMNVGLTNADTFSPALDAGRASNDHGLFVDPQSVKELTEKGAIMLLSQNGLAGAAVQTIGDEAGNIFGVFKNKRSRARNASASLIIQAVAQGGNKLDCYDGGLRRLYAKAGFVPVSRVGWNDSFHREVDPETGEVTWDDGWNYERDGKPDVVAWMLKPGETAESIAAKYGLSEAEGGFHLYSDEEIANLPAFEDTVDENGEVTEWGYDKALNYRNKLLEAKSRLPQNDPNAPKRMDGKKAYAGLAKRMGVSEISELYQDLVYLSADLGEEVTQEDWEATPEVQWMRENSLHGSSLGMSVYLETIDELNSGKITFDQYVERLNSMFTPERVNEQQEVKNQILNEGSAVLVVDENGKAKYHYTGEVEQGKIAHIFMGLPATGKSKVADVISEAIKARIVDNDDIKEHMSDDDGGLNNGYLHVESSFIHDQVMNEVLKRGDNLILPIIGYRSEQLDAYTKLLKDAGYEIHLHRTDLPQTKAIGRAMARAGAKSKNIDVSYLYSVDTNKINEVYEQMKKEGKVDAYAVWSTDVDPKSNPIPLEASSEQESSIFTGRGSETPGTPQNSEDTIRPGDGSGLSGPDGGEGGGLTTEPAVNNPPTEPPVNTPEAVDEGNLGFAVPPNPAKGMGHRQWNNKGAQESDILHQQTKDYLLNNDLYRKDTNADQIDRSLSWVKEHATQDDPSGFYGALKEIDSGDFNFWSKDGVVRLQTMIGMAATRGDVDTETRLAEKYYSEVGTDLGQALQARKIFNLMTPIGRKQILRREAEKLQDEYRVQGKKLDLKISDDTLEMAANAKTEAEFAEARRKMELELAEQIPSDWGLRMRTIRFTSMLGNPRTHIRNMAGNGMGAVMVEIKNMLGAALENLAKVPTGERSKAIGRADGTVDFAKKDAKIMLPELQGQAKYYVMNQVERNVKAFGSGKGRTALGRAISKTIGKGYQKFSDFSGDMLEKEDKVFLSYHYVRALSGWMTANGYTPADMKGRTLERGRAYAIEEAQKATYRDANTLASWLTSRATPKQARFAINAVLPFVKTPANIVRRGIEYSPVGLMTSLVKKKKQLEEYKEWEDSGFKGPKPKNAKSPSEAFDSIAAGMTGTMIAGIGAWLASLGILKTKVSDTEKLHGEQDYSLEIGGKSIGIDSIIPLNIPLLFGASLFNEMAEKNQDNSEWWEKLLNTISNIADPIIDTTMMTSLNSLLDTTRYTQSGSAIGALAVKVIANYAASYVPSVVGAVAKTVDPTKRKAYVEPGGTDFGNTVKAMLEQTQNKLPYLSTLNVPYINAWGEDETTSVFKAFLDNFILPDKIQQMTDSKLDETLEELAGVVGDSVKPGSQEKSLTVNKEKINLNDKQWYQYNSSKGRTSKEVLQELIERPEFICLSDSPEVQAELVKKVYKYAKAKAALELFPEKNIADSWTRGALEAGNVVDYIFEKEEENAKEEFVKTHKKSICTSVENSNYEAAKTDLDYLRQAGVSDTSIKSTLTNYFKPLYKEAAKNYDEDEMGKIRAILSGLGLGYENYNFDNWLK